ncbi:hypothetical protein PACTADRAFT_2089 [Pachysolen tannophilus NRRL Y-2460]|uniref:NADH dehydrogenase [ubiquinone] 1 alpha subcomplex subunit n=1 Tax=Pachysolen tannophilus NRRL Y-2460 TaxID=669874 RepID=A0A1E4TVU0_PACTA|nr:hypothetical protein PACTADRAFT_2089 [Pachysolen tannophilus NRRL Y-2460]
MDRINKLIPFRKQLYYKWKSLRDIPFRKRFFIGYDLNGNTYWEFKLESRSGRLRRILEPYKRKEFMVDYYDTVPPPWQQWLRFNRSHSPSLQELIQEEKRIKQLKEKSSAIDSTWKQRKDEKDYEDNLKLEKELRKLRHNELNIEKERKS